MVRVEVVLCLQLGIIRIMCYSHHPLFISKRVEDGPSVTPSLMCPFGAPRAIVTFQVSDKYSTFANICLVP